MNAWLLAGSTMLHFVWVGALVAAIGAAVRLAVRRCGPNVRYAASLVMLAAVASTPVVIAGVLARHPELMANNEPELPVAAHQPPALPGGSASGVRGAAARADAIGDATPGQSPGLMPETFIELKGLPEGDAALQPPALPGGSGDAVGGAVAGGQPLRDATPGQSPGLKREWMRRVVGALPWVWLVGAPVTFVLLAAGLVGSRRLTRAGLPLVDGRAAEVCARLRAALKVSQRVALAAVEGLAQPVLVGIVKPTILLPAAALNGWTIEELEMVLVHELAHVRRWDNLVNLGQRVIEAALFFHPCVWLASRQVRRDREECCDAIVVEHTNAPEAYAELLVSVASNLSRTRTPRAARAVMSLASVSPMAQHALVGRVRRILKLEDEPMWVSRRMMGMLVVLMCVSSMAVYRAFSAPAPVLNDAAVEGEEERAKPQAADKTEIRVYPIGDIEAIHPAAWMRVTGRKGVEIMWHEENQAMIVSAPPSVHDGIADVLRQGRDASRPAGVLEVEERLDGGDHKTLDADKLRSLIGANRTLLLQVERDLADAEVMKQVAIQQAQSPSALDAAVAAVVDKDPSVLMYRQWLNEVDGRSEAYVEFTQNLYEAEAVATQKARERLAKIPNEALRATMTQYNVRVEYLTKKKAELEAKLKELEAQFEKFTGEDTEKPAAEIPKEVASIPVIEDRAIKLSDDENDGEVELRINADGSATLDGEGVTPEQLGERMAGRGDVQLRLLASESRPYKEVVAWMDALQAAGVHRISAVTSRGANETENSLASQDASEATAAQMQPERAPRTPYRLGPGDTLQVRALGVLPDQPVDGPFVVEDEGTIALGPLYGRVDVAGLSVREAEAAVLKSLTESLKDVVKDPPKVQVTIAKKARAARREVRMNRSRSSNHRGPPSSLEIYCGSKSKGRCRTSPLKVCSPCRVTASYNSERRMASSRSRG
jgi:beta-lactamase regulating signal transducer with metallopeptidase domain/biopolymer transport protein ExbD